MLPGASKDFFNDLTISKNSLDRVYKAQNDGSVLIAGVPVARSSKPYSLEPAVVATPPPTTAQELPFKQENFGWMALLIGVLTVGSLVIVGYLSKRLLEVGQFADHIREIIELFTILIIVSVVLILAMVSDIGPAPVVGVLSGIAGYVLGRSAR